MAYVSYLHMERTHRQVVHHIAAPIETENVIQEPIPISVNPTVPVEQETDEDASDITTIAGESEDERESSHCEGEEAENDADDVSSVGSSIYHRREPIQREPIQREPIQREKETMLPTSNSLRYGPTNNQQYSTDPSITRRPGEQSLAFQMDRHRDNSMRKLKYNATVPEQQQLMSATSRR